MPAGPCLQPLSLHNISPPNPGNAANQESSCRMNSIHQLALHNWRILAGSGEKISKLHCNEQLLASLHPTRSRSRHWRVKRRKLLMDPWEVDCFLSEIHCSCFQVSIFLPPGGVPSQIVSGHLWKVHGVSSSERVHKVTLKPRFLGGKYPARGHNQIASSPQRGPMKDKSICF